MKVKNEMKRNTSQSVQATGFGDATAWRNAHTAGNEQEYTSQGQQQADECCETDVERAEYVSGWNEAATQYNFFSSAKAGKCSACGITTARSDWNCCKDYSQASGEEVYLEY